MKNRVEIKAEARQLLRGARVSPLLMTAVVLGIGFVLDRVVDLVENGSLLYTYTFHWDYLQLLMRGDLYTLGALIDSIPEVTAVSSFFSVLVTLFTLVLNGGYYVYCMGIRQGLEMPCSTLAEGLGVAGKLIWCWVQITVRVFLWTLLFFIPGLVALYRYRFAFYNILTDSTLSAGDAIRLSCQQTMGIKGALFVLDLSFLGWEILSAFTMGLLHIWLVPYQVVCDLAYFEDAQQRMGRAPYGGAVPPPAGGTPWEL
ncbi:MAG: DUF975 family protein [Oscillospiraceae bacterium]|nr:DUF975 family protein [Oscillospiraceae bacterium]